MAAIPLSSAIGSPVSAALLGLHGARGLAGWQWLFIVEALPSIVLSFVAYFYLTDRPRDAKWLSASERDWLQGRLDAGDARRAHVSPGSIFASLYDHRVLALALGMGDGAFIRCLLGGVVAVRRREDQAGAGPDGGC